MTWRQVSWRDKVRCRRRPLAETRPLQRVGPIRFPIQFHKPKFDAPDSPGSAEPPPANFDTLTRAQNACRQSAARTSYAAVLLSAAEQWHRKPNVVALYPSEGPGSRGISPPSLPIAGVPVAVRSGPG